MPGPRGPAIQFLSALFYDMWHSCAALGRAVILAGWTFLIGW